MKTSATMEQYPKITHRRRDDKAQVYTRQVELRISAWIIQAQRDI